MEECGRGAAVEQLTARGMEYQSPKWGAIAGYSRQFTDEGISIPAMGGNSMYRLPRMYKNLINPRNGGQ